MILGIDVGGTHTDAVLLERFKVVRKEKVITDRENLLRSLLEVTEKVLGDISPGSLKRVVLSTTMSTNAIVQGRISPVGMILASGPGLPPSLLRINEHSHIVSGCVNHRGEEVAAIDAGEIAHIVRALRDEGIDHVGIVGKFSTRDPKIELDIERLVRSRFTHVSLGHQMSGNLNFPRRIATTYLNAAIWETYHAFIRSITQFVARFDAHIPVYILKADGGTIEIGQSTACPVQTILSGPAASIMGILSLVDCVEDAVALDIGGTTTDIAIFAGGVPLLEPLGITIQGHKTLVRGLRTRSIGIGGDSRVACVNGRLSVGPVREGPAASLGGPCPTPTDAMVVLGLASIGDRGRAARAIEDIAAALSRPLEETARLIMEHASREIITHVRTMIEEINNKPVYTVHELLEGAKIEPKAMYVVGGPSGAMAPRLGELFGVPVHIPGDAEVANAIGAALARTTTELTVLADTEKGRLTIVEEGIQQRVERSFTRDDAVALCREKLRARALAMGAWEDDIEIEITEDQSFTMVRNSCIAGRNIRIKGQVKPGLIHGARR